jgi:type III secretion protein Q
MSAVMVEDADSVVSPAIALSLAPELISISEQALEVARLYGRGTLLRTIGDTRWKFRWCCLIDEFSGVELRLRVGNAEVMLGLESLDTFSSAVSLTCRQVPSELRAAYISGVGASLWEELEALLGRAVEVLDVHSEREMKMTAECLGFAVCRDPHGAVTQGFLRLADPGAQVISELYEVLLEASQREMAAAPLPRDLPLRWAAIVGSTMLQAGEVGALEEHDIVLIDDARHSADALECWLGVSASRRYAGRAMFRNGGQLQLVQFGTGGRMTTTNSDSPSDEVTFADIPVSLRFELAQWTAPLADVADLEAGSIIDLGNRIDEHAVSVWVEQRCIGKGQLVAIGERLGVRLLSVFAARST